MKWSFPPFDLLREFTERFSMYIYLAIAIAVVLLAVLVVQCRKVELEKHIQKKGKAVICVYIFYVYMAITLIYVCAYVLPGVHEKMYGIKLYEPLERALRWKKAGEALALTFLVGTILGGLGDLIDLLAYRKQLQLDKEKMEEKQRLREEKRNRR